MTAANVLAHPTRVAILRELADGPAEVNAIAATIGTPVELTAYHVRALRGAGVIVLDGQRAVRGAIAHRYRLVPAAARELARQLRADADRLERLAADD